MLAFTQNVVSFVKLALGDMEAITDVCERLLNEKAETVKTFLGAAMAAKDGLFSGSGE